ncbi:MAG: histidine ammonia-lyase [Planctomycetes bacterium]|nr:histidine ammonia-lyase [Planctomycetota bacterium]
MATNKRTRRTRTGSASGAPSSASSSSAAPGAGLPEATPAGTIRVTGSDLSLTDLAQVIADPHCRLQLGESAVERVLAARRVIENALASGATLYGVNTGFGKLSGVRIPPAQIADLQVNLLRSHAVGLGPPLSDEEVRLTMLLRVNALARGCSGVTLELLRTFVELFNRGVVPVVPEQGSVGASGDLAPLAHLALVILGEGEARFGGERLPGGEALRRAGLAPHQPGAKEGLSLINGTQVSTGILASVLVRARDLCRVADLAGATSLEALKGTLTAFDPRIQAVRPHPGQQASARNVQRLLAGSEILLSHKECGKVQDPYSIRCIPQVHGASRDALEHVARVLEIEINSATDNPLVFVEEQEVLSGGNFHAQPIALSADFAAIALAELASISERRIETLVNPDLSGLPAFLTREGGLNSGMMITQVTAASLVSENKVLTHPASVDSIPTSANKEDHVSMATWGARKCRQVLRNAEHVLAIELLCASQGLHFLAPLGPGKGVAAAQERIRRQVTPLERDRALHADIEAIAGMIRDGSLLAAAVGAAGELE